MRRIIGLSLIGAALAGGGVVALAAPPASEQQFAAATSVAEPAPETSVRIALDPQSAKLAAERRMLPAGVKSLLRVPQALEHGDYVWNDRDVGPGKVQVFVNMRRQLISVFRDGHEIGTAVIVYGGNGHDSPSGRFPIMRKVRDYHSRSYDAPMPYSLFITNDGVALHGSPMAADRATHGCIGLPLSFARLLFDQAKRGDVVEIVQTDAA